MKRTLKTLGSVAAILSVLAATGASPAVAAEFHTSSAPVTITGTQATTNVITTNAGTITCKVFTQSGTQSTKTSSMIEVSLKFEQCTAFGFINVPIHMNNCKHQLYASGTTILSCPAGQVVEVTTPGCTTYIGPQHMATGATYTTIGTTPNRHVTAHRNYSGMHYVECGSTRTNLTWKGTTTFTVSGEIWYSGP